jgi:hypothetical protein
MWQEVIVGFCVLVAGGFVLRRYWPKSGTGGAANSACGGCSGCPKDKRTCK